MKLYYAIRLTIRYIGIIISYSVIDILKKSRWLLSPACFRGLHITRNYNLTRWCSDRETSPSSYPEKEFIITKTQPLKVFGALNIFSLVNSFKNLWNMGKLEKVTNNFHFTVLKDIEVVLRLILLYILIFLSNKIRMTLENVFYIT